MDAHLTLAPTFADDDGAAGGSARSFEDDQALLGDVLAEVIAAGEGNGALATHRRAVELGGRSRAGDEAAARELAELVAGLKLGDMEVLVRSLTRWFELSNLAEDNDRVRRVRGRDPLAAAVRRLAAGGTGADELERTLAHVELRLVLTAHPTEARRATTVEKLARVFAVLRELDDRLPAARDDDDARRRLTATVQELWGSDELRTVSPGVLDEVRAGLVYFTSTLGHVVPAFYRRLEAALDEAFPGADIAVPPLLTFGSWIGGDRDGNPYVTPDVTAEALAMMRETCLRFLEARVEWVGRRLSLSSRVVGEAAAVGTLLDGLGVRFPALARELERRHPEEPYRRALGLIHERLRCTRRGADGGYGGPDQLLAELRLLERSLRESRAGYVAGAELRDLIRQVEVFGFHFARLDVRENAKVHRAAIAEVLEELGVCESYADLPEEERTALLTREIADRRPLIPSDISGFGDSTREAIETFRTLHALLTGDHSGAIQSYVISNAGSPSDVLEVLLLMKESRLARAGGEGAMLRIVPLLEEGETLAAAADTMGALLDEPVYRAALASMGDEQEVMIGYSDSNKDVGYVASGWATYRAQIELAEVLRSHGLRWTFFHGRGGAVGRGGGPSHLAVLGQPPRTVEGRIKVTEQGEVLSAKYSLREIAARELDLLASAVLETTLDGASHPHGDRLRRFEAIAAEMAEVSSREYRALVYEDDEFTDFFHAVTPVEQVSRLQLGSRPPKRKASRSITDFRAIPWVFSWTQARIVLPAWFGLGTALERTRKHHGVGVLREMASDWPFFAGLVSNAAMACAKADLGIGRRYADLCEDETLRERIWRPIEAELLRTQDELVRIGGGRRLLDGDPVLQRSLDRRNPYADPLSYVQLELIRRSRAARDGEGDELARATSLTINGIAGALRNTG
ncbi:MAG: phosphoenolpyruvate carboxylase [Thermoleophilaceae bacterium]|nr:phosphoenolpyruvate carboxylase [Thermoleophilaceae bacterium]